MHPICFGNFNEKNFDCVTCIFYRECLSITANNELEEIEEEF